MRNTLPGPLISFRLTTSFVGSSIFILELVQDEKFPPFFMSAATDIEHEESLPLAASFDSRQRAGENLHCLLESVILFKNKG